MFCCVDIATSSRRDVAVLTKTEHFQ